MSDAVERVVARWRAAHAWQPPAKLPKAVRYVADPFPLQPAPRAADAELLLAAYGEFDQLNTAHFGGVCPPVKLALNPRLRSTGGRVQPARRLIELNAARLGELPETRIETIFHEMIHLWLYARGLPSGHTPAFKQKMAERGHTSIYYGTDDPKGPRHRYRGDQRRVIYRCGCCGYEYRRRRRYAQAMLCGRCLAEERGRQPIVEVRVEGGD